MVMEALTIKLKQLRGRLADLMLARKQIEQSDGKSYSNGRIASVDGDIQNAQRQIAAWYADNELTFLDGDKRVSISKLDPHGFEIAVADLSRPGVIKTISAKVREADVEDIVDYLGGRQVYYGSNYIDALSAVAVMRKEIDALREDRDSQQRAAIDAGLRIAELEKEMEESDPPPRRKART